ncbi:MAG: mechanosensitive ion channel protein MscL [Crocinitomicaceae bacterium]|jgi:large conductance mechanosensitive channel|nr:mechanosensitive ion channel protein MscL [Crocinitomicaceae bacterium]
MLKEFKEFIMRGNVVDLAVAVIIGSAFNTIVSSLINDVITPLILSPAMKTLGVSKLDAVAWNGVLYGKFLASVINFLVTAFIVFLLIKTMNRFKRKKEQEPAAQPAPSREEILLGEIRDLLKNK